MQGGEGSVSLSHLFEHQLMFIYQYTTVKAYTLFCFALYHYFLIDFVSMSEKMAKFSIDA